MWPNILGPSGPSNHQLGQPDESQQETIESFIHRALSGALPVAEWRWGYWSALWGQRGTALLIFRDWPIFQCWSCCWLNFWGLSGFEAVASCSHESGLLDSCLQIHTMCSGPTFPQMIARNFRPRCFKQLNFYVFVIGRASISCTISLASDHPSLGMIWVMQAWKTSAFFAWVPIERFAWEFLSAYQVMIASWKSKTRNSYYKAFLLRAAVERWHFV